ncbi:MAG: hypothetical protein HYX68_00060 [Planctomycetes bacterium]|nr:hypothetical protein [Planctomycetota bacterium]
MEWFTKSALQLGTQFQEAGHVSAAGDENLRFFGCCVDQLSQLILLPVEEKAVVMEPIHEGVNGPQIRVQFVPFARLQLFLERESCAERHVYVGVAIDHLVERLAPDEAMVPASGSQESVKAHQNPHETIRPNGEIEGHRTVLRKHSISPWREEIRAARTPIARPQFGCAMSAIRMIDHHHLGAQNPRIKMWDFKEMM